MLNLHSQQDLIPGPQMLKTNATKEEPPLRLKKKAKKKKTFSASHCKTHNVHLLFD